MILNNIDIKEQILRVYFVQSWLRFREFFKFFVGTTFPPLNSPSSRVILTTLKKKIVFWPFFDVKQNYFNRIFLTSFQRTLFLLFFWFKIFLASASQAKKGKWYRVLWKCFRTIFFFKKKSLLLKTVEECISRSALWSTKRKSKIVEIIRSMNIRSTLFQIKCSIRKILATTVIFQDIFVRFKSYLHGRCMMNV